MAVHFLLIKENTMKLYYSKGACSLAVRITIHELGLPCEYEAVDLKTKVTKTNANFLTVNPKGQVPTLLTDDNVVITENAVIQQYLVEHFDGHVMLPPVGDMKRYKVLEWLNFVSTDIHKGFGPLFNPKVPEALKAEIFIPMLKNKFGMADRSLEKNKYLAGDKFTIPDSYLYVMLTWTRMMKIDLSEFSNLARYFDELSKRKSIVEALAEE